MIPLPLGQVQSYSDEEDDDKQFNEETKTIESSIQTNKKARNSIERSIEDLDMEKSIQQMQQQLHKVPPKKINFAQLIKNLKLKRTDILTLQFDDNWIHFKEDVFQVQENISKIYVNISNNEGVENLLEFQNLENISTYAINFIHTMELSKNEYQKLGNQISGLKSLREIILKNNSDKIQQSQDILNILDSIQLPQLKQLHLIDISLYSLSIRINLKTNHCKIYRSLKEIGIIDDDLDFIYNNNFFKQIQHNLNGISIDVGKSENITQIGVDAIIKILNQCVNLKEFEFDLLNQVNNNNIDMTVIISQGLGLINNVQNGDSQQCINNNNKKSSNNGFQDNINVCKQNGQNQQQQQIKCGDDNNKIYSTKQLNKFIFHYNLDLSQQNILEIFKYLKSQKEFQTIEIKLKAVYLIYDSTKSFLKIHNTSHQILADIGLIFEIFSSVRNLEIIFKDCSINKQDQNIDAKSFDAQLGLSKYLKNFKKLQTLQIQFMKGYVTNDLNCLSIPITKVLIPMKLQQLKIQKQGKLLLIKKKPQLEFIKLFQRAKLIFSQNLENFNISVMNNKIKVLGSSEYNLIDYQYLQDFFKECNFMKQLSYENKKCRQEKYQKSCLIMLLNGIQYQKEMIQKLNINFESFFPNKMIPAYGFLDLFLPEIKKYTHLQKFRQSPYNLTIQRHIDILMKHNRIRQKALYQSIMWKKTLKQKKITTSQNILNDCIQMNGEIQVVKENKRSNLMVMNPLKF